MLETPQILLLGVSVESLKQNIGPSPPPHPYLYISKQNIYVEESVSGSFVLLPKTALNAAFDVLSLRFLLEI